MISGGVWCTVYSRKITR